MVNVGDSNPYFLCLCGSERQPPLALACAGSEHRVEFHDQIETLLSRALDQPPLGLILELATAIRFGAERMSKFLNLGVNWPVMRCAISPDGEARIMCFEPPHGEPLLDALSAIAAHDPSWKHPRFIRKHLRLNIPGRVKLREAENEPWFSGNLEGISCGGCFVIMTHGAPAIGSPVELEMHDFQPKSQRVRGRITWQRRWSDSLELPGVGIEFEAASISAEFRHNITHSPQLADLITEA